MDYIEGEPLSKIIKEHGPQPQEIVVAWGKQLCEVLYYLHTRKPAIIYRDMKPSNIMLRPDGNIKLIDFGIAREYKEDNTEDTDSLGTKGYAAPEQFGGNGQTDARTDIYCLGVTLYHLVTGRNPCKEPYEVRPIREVNAALSGGLEQIILKCTRKNPNERYQTAMELLYALSIYERFDEKYRERQKKSVRKFTLLAGATICCCFIGTVSLFLKSKVENENYESVVAQAQTATDNEEAIALYVNAIHLKPSEITTYIELIQEYKEDASFSLSEQEQLIKLVNENIVQLKNQSNYYEMAFEIGKLYWYYYDYGKGNSSDNQVTRMKSSIQWFEDVLTYGNPLYENYNMAKVYASIGKFNRDINLSIEEAADKGSYAPYWTNLVELLKEVLSSHEESEIVRLELYKTILYGIETYARKFRNDGIAREELQLVYKQLAECIDVIEVSTDKTRALRDLLLVHKEGAESAIVNAFRESELD